MQAERGFHIILTPQKRVCECVNCPLVLIPRALSSAPFEALSDIEMQLLSLKLKAICPVRALCVHMEWTLSLRKTEQLFICFC